MAPDEATPATAAAFFDLDKTILAGSSTYALGRGLRERGLISPSAAARSVYSHAAYLRRGADHSQMERMRELLAELVRGWRVDTVHEVVSEAMERSLLPMVLPEAAELIRWHHQFGRHVVVISSGAQEVVGPVGDALGADRTVGSALEVVDGRYTGVVTRYMYGLAKADVARGYAREHDLDLSSSFAYTDSITDLPLLEVVGRPHAVNPDRRLADVATERGWPVLELARATNDSRTPLPGGGSVSQETARTVGAVGVLTASAGLGLYLARRRRSRR